MLLNGWKEIATYLRSGIRTVQRWEGLGLPVIRVRPGDRGPVVARTEQLDAWLTARGQKSKGRMRPDLEASFERSASLRAAALDELRVFLQNELRVGLGMAASAGRTKDVARVQRFTAMARQAYDSILRISSRADSLTLYSKQFSKDLEHLKVTLRNLGEDV